MLTDQTFEDSRPWIGIGPELFLDEQDLTGINADAVYVFRTVLQPNTFCRFLWVDSVLADSPENRLPLLSELGVRFPVRVHARAASVDCWNWLSQCWCIAFSTKFCEQFKNNLPTKVLMDIDRARFLNAVVISNQAPFDTTKEQFFQRVYGY